MCDHCMEGTSWVGLELLTQLAFWQTSFLTPWCLFFFFFFQKKQKVFACLKPCKKSACFLLAYNDCGIVCLACDCSTPPQRHPGPGKDWEICTHGRVWALAALHLCWYSWWGEVLPTQGCSCLRGAHAAQVEMTVQGTSQHTHPGIRLIKCKALSEPHFQSAVWIQFCYSMLLFKKSSFSCPHYHKWCLWETGSLFLLPSLHPILKTLIVAGIYLSGLLAQIHSWCVRLIVFRRVTPKTHLAFCAVSIIGGTGQMPGLGACNYSSVNRVFNVTGDLGDSVSGDQLEVS